jgi:hypothetical protein
LKSTPVAGALLLSSSLLGPCLANSTNLEALALKNGNWEIAEVADLAYSEPQSSGRWRRLATSKDLLGLNDQKLAELSGFNAVVYRNTATGAVVVGMRGTDQNLVSAVARPHPFVTASNRDWLSSREHAAGRESDQHDKLAPKLVAAAVRRFGPVTCAGDSLGGALAAIGCGRNGMPSVTTNTAGVNPRTARTLNAERTTNFRYRNDPALRAFGLAKRVSTVGQVAEIDQPSGESILGSIRDHTARPSMLAALRQVAARAEQASLSVTAARPEPRVAITRPECAIDYGRSGSLPPHCYDLPVAERSRGVQIVCLETYGEARQAARRAGTGMPLENLGRRTPDSQCYRPSYKFEDSACQSLIEQATEGRIGQHDRRLTPCMEILKSSGVAIR